MTRSKLLRTIDDEALYRQLQALLNTMPDFEDIDDDVRRWLGRLSACVKETGAVTDHVELSRQTARLGEQLLWFDAVSEIKNILFRALAFAELGAPSAAQGAFIAAGNEYDAFSAVSKILAEARSCVLIVDPYLDAAIFDFSLAVGEGIKVRLLTDESGYKETLKPALSRWIAQHGQRRPVELLAAPRRTLHDRSIQIDSATAWICTQSFNALAQRSPATLSRLEGDAGRMRIDAYETIWAAGTPV